MVNEKATTQAGTTGWTIETLKEYVDQRFDASERAVKAALDAAEKAVSAALAAADRAVGKAEVAAEKRLDSVNEFRGQLKDQAATLLPRRESDTKFAALEDRIKKIEAFMAQLIGGESRQSAIKTTSMWLVGLLIATIVAVTAIVLKR